MTALARRVRDVFSFGVTYNSGTGRLAAVNYLGIPTVQSIPYAATITPNPWLGEVIVVGALNGDVDNHADLKAEFGLRIATPITTDAKVIPTLVSRQLATGTDLLEAFRSLLIEGWELDHLLLGFGIAAAIFAVLGVLTLANVGSLL